MTAGVTAAPIRVIAPRTRTAGLARAGTTLLAVLAIWYAVAALLRLVHDPGASKLPFPHEVVSAYITYSGTFIEAAWQTGSRAIIGFFAGLGLGLLFGVVIIQSRWLEAAFVPYVLASQMIPLVALVPIVRAVLRDADLVRVYITAYVSFFVVTIAVLRGLRNVSPAALELMESLNASRWTTLRFVRLHAALPYIFSGLRIAAPLSLIGAILVDFLGARNGLGYLLVASLTLGSSQSANLWGALVLSMALGLVLTQLVAIAERRMSFWQPAFRTEARA
ncbi:MAG: NitT/TauT family transport system permease protein [Chloroflexota bacterium]|jgi:NitT/TauT family transport system permease protein|nr:NitT/TauT family transport system permease protein [Chloroflexota bacterium]